ncbi:DHA2 family efflux MFS transporter permease subunit [Nitratireductor basaltis]|uniref:Major facilitator superfamily transporter n=1 Tax=Nitratireductor basaltis TaxID=472175 RepID=A0A084UCZ3_9HYPH|nr:DHA2 family efflux MFS transporter permease subunit [Nitratireductor basaltis]KFB10829.1 Major facilitator superfamily transporter [Nitratireductor basaltis]
MNRALPLVLAVALFMEQMDSTVIATSLPAIAADIGTSPVTLKLALTTYLVALAIFIPISGWMADRFGAKKVFRLAIAVFVLGSIACAFANSLVAFVLARFLQGMGGAMMTPVGRLVLVRATPRHQLVNAMAWLAVPALIGPIAGPPLGGFITTYFSWHWIFLINVPIGLAGIAMAGRVLPEIEAEQLKRLDAKGFLLSGIAASGIVFGLSVISLPALPPMVGIITVLAGIAAVLLYRQHATRVENPVLDLTLFRDHAFRSAIFGGFIFRVGVGATPFLLPLMFQLVFGLNPFQSGMLTFASAIGALAMKFGASRILRVGGFRQVLIISALLGSVFITVNAAFTAQTPHAVIIAVLIAGGFLRSLFFTSTNALVFAEIGDREAGQATAIAAASQQISIALGVAVGGGVLEATAWLGDGTIGANAFTNAFIVVGLVTAFAAVPFLALPPEAGSSVSGHRRDARTPDDAAQPAE